MSRGLIDAARTRRSRGRRRLMLAGGAIVALVFSFALASKSSSSGFASTSVVLDTPASEVVDAAPFGTESLPWRASLLAHLMASERVKQRLGGVLGVPTDQIAVIDPALSEPDVPASLPKAAAEGAAISEAPYRLVPYVKDVSIPIISIKARAPDRDGAAQLAAAAASVLKAAASPSDEPADVSFGDAKTEAARIVPSAVQGFVADDLAPLRVRTVSRRQSPIKAVVLSVGLFGMWCMAVAVGPRLVRLIVGERGRIRPA